MNKERMLAVANAIEQSTKDDSPLRFDMSVYYVTDRGEPGCNTAACIAGWTVFLFGDDAQKKWLPINTYQIADMARDLLGLSEVDADRLFHCADMDVDLDYITIAEAVQCLRESDDGNIAWPDSILDH